MNQQPMSTLAQLAELLLQNTQATLVGDGALAINRVHTDTRTLQAGDLFVALRGERFDANNFLEQARAAGAAAALCRAGRGDGADLGCAPDQRCSAAAD